MTGRTRATFPGHRHRVVIDIARSVFRRDLTAQGHATLACRAAIGQTDRTITDDLGPR
jgi:hypothetical protein